MTKDHGLKLSYFDSKWAGCRMVYPETLGVDQNMIWWENALNEDSDDLEKSKRPYSCMMCFLLVPEIGWLLEGHPLGNAVPC